MFVDRGLNFHCGVSKALLNLARGVDPARLQIEIGSLEPPSSEMLGEFSRLKPPVHWLGDRSYPASAWALRRVLARRDISLVVCSSLRSYLVAKLALLGRPGRVVFWVHGMDQIISSALKAAVFRRLSERDTLIFISGAVRQATLPPRRRGRHRVVYNGVERPTNDGRWWPYSRERRAEFGLSTEDVVLGYVGSFEPYKDQRTLLLAFEQLCRQHDRLQLLLIGRGEELAEMQTLAASLDCRARVHFLGPRPDARSLLGLLDLYVHPCYAEGFGLAVVEAMLAGVPVVAAGSGGLPEVVCDNRTGLLFRAQDPVDLSRQLSRLIDYPLEARRLALAGQRDALERFSPQVFAEQITQLLEEEQTLLPGPAAARSLP